MERQEEQGMNQTEQLKAYIEELKTRIRNYGENINEIEARRRELASVVEKLKSIAQEPNQNEEVARHRPDGRPTASRKSSGKAPRRKSR